ncbi:hypothetical protein NQ318_003627, partial [Aromia moschata]
MESSSQSVVENMPDESSNWVEISKCKTISAAIILSYLAQNLELVKSSTLWTCCSTNKRYSYKE